MPETFPLLVKYALVLKGATGTLFSFISAKGRGSLSEFVPKYNETFNLSYVYDYITYTFFSTLSEANADSMSWSAIKNALDRVESGILQPEIIEDARKIVKTIGLILSGNSLNKRISSSFVKYLIF